MTTIAIIELVLVGVALLVGVSAFVYLVILANGFKR